MIARARHGVQGDAQSVQRLARCAARAGGATCGSMVRPRSHGMRQADASSRPRGGSTRRAAGPPPRRAEAVLALRDGRLRIAAVSDTHGKPHPNADAVLRAMAPDAILHGGDIGDLAVLDRLGAIAPVIAVRGNIDERAPHLPDVVVIDVRDRDGSVLRILLTHVAVAGPRIRADAARLAREAGARLVVCGHSHVPFLGAERGLTVVNAGSIGPRRFSLPIVLARIEIADGRLSITHVDCETGEPWSP